MPDQINKAKDACASGKGDMNPRCLHKKSFAHRTLDLVKQASLRQTVYLFRQSIFGSVILYVEKHFVLVCLVKQISVKIVTTVCIETENIGRIKVRAHSIANGVMSNDVSTLERTDPKVLRQGFEAIVVLLKVRHSFSIN